MSAQVVRFPIRFPSTRLPIAAQATVDVAAQNVRSAVCDFVIAINETGSPTEALQLHILIDALMLELGAVDDMALDRANRLNQ